MVVNDADDVFDRLLATDVIERTGDDEQYVLTAGFQSTVQQYRDAIELFEGVITPEAVQELLEIDIPLPGRLDDIEPALLAEYCAVMDALQGRPEGVFVYAVLDQFRRDQPPVDGSPDPFLSVRADRLPILLDFYPAAVVYIWRRQCPPCETIKRDLEEIFDATSNEMALLAVYGPDWARFLEQTYEVVGAPTILFLVNGAVDARLIGMAERDAIEREIDLLREVSDRER